MQRVIRGGSVLEFEALGVQEAADRVNADPPVAILVRALVDGNEPQLGVEARSPHGTRSDAGGVTDPLRGPL